jgi:C-terminal processing protease CtpA/Prc
LVRGYFDDELRVACNDAVEYGILDGNLGYVGITNFKSDDMMAEFPAVMDFLDDTHGLIFDVRNNTGGDHDRVEAVVRSFIDSTMPWPKAFEKGGEHIEPWPPMQPDSSRQLYTNPVVVLINGASLSSGELFPEVMKQLPNVTVVGDTTAGAGCNDRGGFRGNRRLPSGKLIHIPTWCICRYDGVPWETVGIAPDIRAVQTEGDVASGVDRQLEFAIEMLQTVF